MKNLKQVLALGMAFSLTMSTMASAAFSDSADIKAAEAVNMLSALGVINGYEDGSFKPEGVVTRAEAAKMIFTIRNGGNSDASAWSSLPTTFTDLNGYGWAEGYIKYCQSMNIIAGKSATKFDPGAPVTGVELAKMMLVTLGYNPEVAGLTGASWANKTLGLAGENALLDDVNADLASGLPRQYAAQLMYNAVLAPTVVLRDGQYTNQKLVTGVAGQTDYNETIGEKYMGLKEETGILTATGKTGVNGEVAAKNDTIEIDKKSNGYTLASDTTFTKVSGDYSALLGQEVKVLYKNSDEVYGVYATDNNNVVETSLGDMELTDSNSKIKVNGTKYDLNSSTISGSTYGTHTVVSVNGAAVSAVNAMGVNTKVASTVKMIDHNGDDKIDLITVVKPTAVAEVTFVGAESITVSGQGSFDFDDNTIYAGAAKGDFAVIYPAAVSVDGKTNIIKAETVQGKVTGAKTDEVQVDGNWYKKAATVGGDTINLDGTYKLVMFGGYIQHAVKVKDGENTSVVYVSEMVSKSGLGAGSKFDARIYKADGTTEAVVVSKVNGNTPSVSRDENKFYTYKIVDGEYELTSVSASNLADYEYYVAGDSNFTVESGKFNDGTNTYKFADDAVVYVQNTAEDKATVVTGKSVSKWSSDWGTAGAALISVENGVKYVKVAYVTAGTDSPSSTSDVQYGYVTSDVYTTKIDNETYAVYKIWNGSEEITGYENVTAPTAAKGDAIEYKTSDAISDGVKITSVGKAFTQSAITEYNGSDYVKVNGLTPTEIDKDTKIIYIDSKNIKGATGSIVIATEKADGSYAKNVMYRTSDATGAVDVLFVDVNNQLYDTNGNAVSDVAGATYSVTGTGLTNTGNSGTLTAVSDYTLTVTGPSSVNLNALKKGDEVSLSIVGGASASAGVVTVKVTPADGSEVITRTFNFAAGSTTTPQTNKFTMPAANATITVTAPAIVVKNTDIKLNTLAKPANSTPLTSAADNSGTGYTVKSTAWEKSDDGSSGWAKVNGNGETGKYYRATITLEPKAGYTFTGSNITEVTLDGLTVTSDYTLTSTINSDGNLELVVTFVAAAL